MADCEHLNKELCSSVIVSRVRYKHFLSVVLSSIIEEAFRRLCAADTGARGLSL